MTVNNKLSDLQSAWKKMEESEKATSVSKKFGIDDKNSKPVKPTATEMGSVAGRKEVGDDHGTKKAVEGANPVNRKEGSGDAIKQYSDFRAKIKSVLGLSLTDPLNATGKGLNK